MIYLLILCLVVHLAYYLFIFIRIGGYKHQKVDIQATQDLSIVVCFKNEISNVEKLLNQLIAQDADEIVLVDDFSIDGTYDNLKTYKSDRIKVIKATLDLPGKKRAAQDGMNAARNTRVLFTDADCLPRSNRWASHMGSVDRAIVLGYSPMRKTKEWINLFARFETYMTGVQYLSYAIIGLPYMGVGRNMLIDKSIKDESKIKGKHLASGDDDLTVNALANKKNTSICIHADSHMYTDSASSLAEFIRQKTRHISTSVHYKLIHQLMLGTFSGSQIAFYIILILGVITGTISISLGITAYVVKQGVQMLVHSILIKKMKESIPIHQLLLLDLQLFLYYLLMPFILLIYKNDNRWS